MAPQAAQRVLREGRSLVSTRVAEIESAITEMTGMGAAIEGIGIVIGIVTIEETGIEGVKMVVLF